MSKFEQLARALSVNPDGRDLARIAIEALREPTDEMWAAGLRVEYAHKDSTDSATKAIWQAMLDSASDMSG